MEKLSGKSLSDIDAGLAEMGWAFSSDGRAIEKQFIFRGFPQAMSFMSMVAWHAEEADHHPEWSNVYNRVDVHLTTHDADGLTQKDLTLAHHMEQAAKLLGEDQ